MKKIIFEKIKIAYRDNNIWRKLQGLSQGFLPFFKKACLFSAIATIFIFLGLYFFKPKYLDKVRSYASNYFFKTLKLSNYEFTQINVAGNDRVLKSQIIKIVNKTKEDFLEKEDSLSYQTLVENLIDNIRQGLPWIKEITISRNMPNVLNISIKEFEPFAIWKNKNKYYISDKDGNLVPISKDESREFQFLVILSGQGAYNHANSLFNIFVVNPKISANVYSATWVGNRRWDIRFDNELLIKLPENNILEAWKRLIKIYNIPGSISGLKVIDLRIMDKIYLEYDNSLVKELHRI